VLVEAKGAAASAASAVAVNSIGDLSRRVGVLEGRLEHGSMSGQDQVSKAKPGTAKRGPKLPKSQSPNRSFRCRTGGVHLE